MTDEKDNARELAIKLRSAVMTELTVDSIDTMAPILAAALAARERAVWEKAAKLAESKYNHRDPSQKASYLAGDFTLDYEAAGDAIEMNNATNPVELVHRAIKNFRNDGPIELPLWAIVMRLFAHGSTVSAHICREYGYDPDMMVKPLARPPGEMKPRCN